MEGNFETDGFNILMGGGNLSSANNVETLNISSSGSSVNVNDDLVMGGNSIFMTSGNIEDCSSIGVDAIVEKTAFAGVNIEDCNITDSTVTAGILIVDSINEKFLGQGVNIELIDITDSTIKVNGGSLLTIDDSLTVNENVIVDKEISSGIYVSPSVSNLPPQMTAASLPAPYVVTQSSIVAAGFEGWKAYNDIYSGNSSWVSSATAGAGRYDPTDGVGKDGTNALTIVDGESVYGEWVSLDVGSDRGGITSYRLATVDSVATIGPNAGTQCPGSWKLCGSNDIFTWTEITNFSDYNWADALVPEAGYLFRDFDLTPEESFKSANYRYYRFIFTKVGIDPVSSGRTVVLLTEAHFIFADVSRILSVNPLIPVPVTQDFPKQLSEFSPNIARESSTRTALEKGWIAFRQFSFTPSPYWWASAFGGYNFAGSYIGTAYTRQNDFFTPKVFGEWIDIELVSSPDPFLVSNMAFMGNVGGLTPYAPNNFRLMGSDDGVVFYAIQEYSYSFPIVNEIKDFPITNPTRPYKYFRLVVTQKFADPTFNATALSALTLSGTYIDQSGDLNLNGTSVINSVLQDTKKNAWASCLRTDQSLFNILSGQLLQIPHNGQESMTRNMTQTGFLQALSDVNGVYKIDSSVELKTDDNAATVRMHIYVNNVPTYFSDSFVMKSVYSTHSLSFIDRFDRLANTPYELRLEAIGGAIDVRGASFNVVRLSDNN
jgi:hypothetical protein